uniref:Uncharacterized protein n=1 Tax=Steinernema glaseri TaxID=37863 RepID=A0A1I8AN72_9BILA
MCSRSCPQDPFDGLRCLLSFSPWEIRFWWNPPSSGPSSPPRSQGESRSLTSPRIPLGTLSTSASEAFFPSHLLVS